MSKVPFAVRGSYQLRNFNAGVPVNPDSIFDALADPPASGVAAEAAALAAAQEIAINRPEADAIKGLTANRDTIRDFYDSASIIHDDTGDGEGDDTGDGEGDDTGDGEGDSV